MNRLFFVPIILLCFCCDLNAFQSPDRRKSPSVAELDMLMLSGGFYREMATKSDEWLSSTREYIDCVFRVVRDRFFDRFIVPDGWREHWVTLLQRERELDHTYHAFYHGCNSRYALFLRLNQLLYERSRSVALPCDMQLLRGKCSREKRERLEKLCADTYEPECRSDGDLRVSQEILSVSQSPFAGLFADYAGPLFFTLRNFSVADGAFDLFIVKLFRAYGYTVPRDMYDLLKTFRPYSGMMLQIFIEESLAEKVVYYSDEAGMPKRSQSVSDFVCDAYSHFADYYHSKKTNLSARNDIFENQLRILLRPSLFDEPNPHVKIFSYDCFTSEEKTLLENICQCVIARSEETRPTGSELKYV